MYLLLKMVSHWQGLAAANLASAFHILDAAALQPSFDLLRCRSHSCSISSLDVRVHSLVLIPSNWHFHGSGMAAAESCFAHAPCVVNHH